jgi:hypothetical protein
VPIILAATALRPADAGLIADCGMLLRGWNLLGLGEMACLFVALANRVIACAFSCWCGTILASCGS